MASKHHSKMKKRNTETLEINIATKDGNGTDAIVEFYYEAGDPGVHTFSNGDPGYPPTGSSIEIISIKDKATGREIQNDEIEDGELDEIENALCEKYDEAQDDDEPFYDEDEDRYKDENENE